MPTSKGCDLIVEAVFEDRGVKAETTKKAQTVLPGRDLRLQHVDAADHPLATEAGKPEKFHRHPLLLAGRQDDAGRDHHGRKTGDRALATALDFVRLIKKTPIVVNDTRGFFANRCVGRYVAEGHLMLMEGVPPAMIENVARMAGMPVGPLSLNDEVAIDLSWKIVQATKGISANRPSIRRRKSSSRRWSSTTAFGRKNGRVSTIIRRAAKKKLWPGLGDLQARNSIPTRST